MPGPAFILQEAVGSPADDAGLQQGDQIMAVAGQSTAAPADVIRLITLHRPGQTIDVTVLRHHVRITVRLTLGYVPIGAQYR